MRVLPLPRRDTGIDRVPPVERGDIIAVVPGVRRVLKQMSGRKRQRASFRHKIPEAFLVDLELPRPTSRVLGSHDITKTAAITLYAGTIERATAAAINSERAVQHAQAITGHRQPLTFWAERLRFEIVKDNGADLRPPR